MTVSGICDPVEALPVSAPVNSVETKEILALTTAMVRSDEEAWREFHRRYYAALVRVAAGVAGDSHAEDAVQAAYVRVARHIKPFAEESQFWPWLCRIVRCAAIDQGRGRTAAARLLAKFQVWRETFPTAPSAPIADTLAEALATLPPEDAALLQDHYSAGWTIAELARREGISEKAMDSRLTRLRRRVREKLLTRHA